jgi:hypothetical protein
MVTSTTTPKHGHPRHDRAAGTDDDAVRADAWKQAAARLGFAARVLEDLAAAATPADPNRWGMDLALPGSSARAALSGPGLR